MTDNSRTLTVGPTLENATIRRLLSVCLALVGLLVLLVFVTTLPGIDRLVAGLSVTPIAILTALTSLLVVGALLWVAPTVERAVEQALDGPRAAVGNAAASAKLLVVFVAVGIAYRGFAPAATPLFEAFDLGGVYHLAFLVVGVAVLAAFARRIYRCWEPLTAVLTAHATVLLGDDHTNGQPTE